MSEETTDGFVMGAAEPEPVPFESRRDYLKNLYKALDEICASVEQDEDFDVAAALHRLADVMQTGRPTRPGETIAREHDGSLLARGSAEYVASLLAALGREQVATCVEPEPQPTRVEPDFDDEAFVPSPSVGGGSRTVTAEEFIAEPAPKREEFEIKQEEDETLPIVLKVRANDAEHRIEVGSVTHLESDLGGTDSWLWLLPAIVLEVAEQVCPVPGDKALLYENLRRRVELEMTRLNRAE